jgi:hypothetical protein
MQSCTYVCVPCRLAMKSMSVCSNCHNPAEFCGYRWRAPKRTNDRAWKMIESGDFMWDKKAIAKKRAKLTHSAVLFEQMVQHWSRKRPDLSVQAIRTRLALGVRLPPES